MKIKYSMSTLLVVPQNGESHEGIRLPQTKESETEL